MINKRIIAFSMAVTYVVAGAIMINRDDHDWAAVQFVLAYLNMMAVMT